MTARISDRTSPYTPHQVYAAVFPVTADPVTITVDGNTYTWPTIYMGGDVENPAGTLLPNGSAPPPTVPGIFRVALNTQLTFNAQVAGLPPGRSIVKWAWDFGNGLRGRGQTITHTFFIDRPTFVHVEAQDDRGQSAYATIPLYFSP